MRYLATFLFLLSCHGLVQAGEPVAPYVVVLGVAQDAGHPQVACARDCCRDAWSRPERRHRVASLGIVDPQSGQRWLIDATPDFPDQLRDLDLLLDSRKGALDGIFLTHAHMGHYTGLLHLGREAMGASEVPVWAMPRMGDFLRANGPWSQLVELKNISLRSLADGVPVKLNDRLSIVPFQVPHRDEFSETVGYVIRGPSRSVVWLPDIDKWSRWSRPVEGLVRESDVAFLDGTFFANGEVPRDMSEIPHPFIVESLERLGRLPPSERAKVRFVHFNHSNPVLQADSEASRSIVQAGFGLAGRGERVSLGATERSP